MVKSQARVLRVQWKMNFEYETENGVSNERSDLETAHQLHESF